MATLTHSKSGGEPTTKSVVALGAADFFAVKGAVESFLARFGIRDLTWQASDFDFFADGEGSEIRLCDQTLGFLGRVSEAVVKEYDLPSAACVAELDFELIVSARTRVPMLKPIPRYPSVNRDLAVVVDDEVMWADIEKAVSAVGAEHLKAMTFFDEFRGKQVSKGKKSLAFAMVFRDETRTLVSEEIDIQVNAIIERLKSDCSAEVRS